MPFAFPTGEVQKTIRASTFPLEKEDGIRMSIGIPVGRADGYC